MKGKLKIGDHEIDLENVNWSEAARAVKGAVQAFPTRFTATSKLDPETWEALTKALDEESRRRPGWAFLEHRAEGIDVQEAFLRARMLHNMTGAKRCGYGCVLARTPNGYYAASVAYRHEPIFYPEGWIPVGWLAPPN